jgi:hypothetical protein
MAAFTALALAGLGFSAYSQYRSGKAQKQAAEAQGEAEALAGLAGQRAKESEAQLAEYNAAVAQLQAKDAEARGVLEANRFRQAVKQVIGSQRAGFAAGNIDVGYGSTVDVQADAAFLGELDALTVRTNAAREAWGYKVEAEDLTRRAAISRMEGVNLAEAGRLAKETGKAAGAAASKVATWGAAGTLLTGTSSLLAAKYGYKTH